MTADSPQSTEAGLTTDPDAGRRLAVQRREE